MKIVLVGNPNVGKSVVFNQLTGRYVSVSNYPGTTVEITEGRLSSDKDSTLIDTPGVNNLIPNSEDEIITRNILFEEKPDLIVQVADAKNLKRSISLTLQLIEAGFPMVLDLNMVDEMRGRGIKVDSQKISEKLGIPVVETIAVQGHGIGKLENEIRKPVASPYTFYYDQEIEEAIKEIVPLMSETGYPLRSAAIMFLCRDKSIEKKVSQKLESQKYERIARTRDRLEKVYSSPLSYVINRARLRKAEGLIEDIVDEAPTATSGFMLRLGNLCMHPYWGVPIMALVLYLIYQFVGVLGAQTLVDYTENVIFGEYINPISTKVVYSILPSQLLRDVIVGEYGIITMALSYGLAIVLPIVATFFLAFGILEDSGYLPRLAIMFDKAFRIMGLNGKAVLPMILGLGCDTMATMTARILDTRKERLQVTLLLALGVPCSAQLGVILGMINVAGTEALLIWMSVVIAVILTVGYLSSKVIPGKRSDFMVEVPPLRIPQASNIVVKTLTRLEWYVYEVVPLFILGTLILFFLDASGFLVLLEDAASPLIVGWLNLPKDATGAFLIGFLRRDYGAAGLFDLMQQGLLSNNQILVSLVTLTLFVPCIANFLMIMKEQGIKIALYMSAFIFPFAFLVGGLLNLMLNAFGVIL